MEGRNLDHYLLFLTMSFLLIILPGPDTGLLTQNTLLHGKKNGMKTGLGSVAGLLIHTLAVTLGLSAILVQSAFIFSIFKYIGAAYLIFIGLVSLKSLRKFSVNNEENKKEFEARNSNSKSKSYFLQGFITNVSNPKVAIFFLTFLPQFVEPHSNHFLQFLMLGISYAILTVLWFLIYIKLIDFFSQWLKRPTVQSALQGLTGLVLMGFGIRLALEKQP
jgi:RhtB (resistance to homoserine/threonine) family protein